MDDWLEQQPPEMMHAEMRRAMDDPSFLEDERLIAAKSLLKEISAGRHRAEDDGDLSGPTVARKAAALSFIASTLSSEEGEIADVPDRLRLPAARLARIWEGLAKLEEGAPREYALLNASCAYELAGYQASAACLARSLEPDRRGTGGELQHIASLFLARRFVELRRECAGLVKEPDCDTVESMPYRLGLAAAARALSDIAGFFLSGSKEGVEGAAGLLKSAGSLLSSHGFYQESALLYGLHGLIGAMAARSTWRILAGKRGRPLWERYMMLLARGPGGSALESRSVSEAWPPQREAVERGLVDSEDSKIVRMPAGSGKARVAEMAILHALDRGERGAKCVYVAPHSALVSEAAKSLSETLPDLGFGVSAIGGAYDDDSLEGDLAAGADVLVMTPEKLDLMLRAHRGRLDGVALFVVDEAHAVGDGRRGLRMEILLARLRRRFSAARFIVMSDALSDESLRELAGWLFGKDAGGGIIEAGWRPAARRLAKFEWPAAAGGECTLVYEGSEGDRTPQVRIDGAIRSETYEHVDPETNRTVRPSFPSAERGETAAELAFRYSAQGTVLVHAAQPAWAVSVALKLERRIALAGRAGRDVPSRFRARTATRSYRAAAEWLGRDHDLTRLLGAGIAVHHGGMPERLRHAVEADVRDQRYPVVAAADALSQGANMPVRTLIVHSCRRYDRRSGREERMPAHEYWSLAGRAGRAGLETEGAVIHIVGSDADRRDYDHYRSRKGRLGGVRSHALRMLEDLAEGRISAEDLEAEIEPEVLGILAEEGVEGGLGAVDDVVSATLAAAQAPEGDAGIAALRGCFRRAAEKAAEMGDSAARAYGGTGLSAESCRRIRAYVRENRDRVAELLSSGSDEDVVSLALIALDLADQMPEMRHGGAYSGDRRRLVEMWLGGAPVSDMLGGAGRGGGSGGAGAARAVDSIMGRDSPWAVSALVRIAALEAGTDAASLPPRVRHLPGMIKYGVASPEASWAMRLGMTSRRAAMSMSADCPEGIGFAGFAAWLAGIDAAALSRRHGAEEGDAARIAAAASGIVPNRLARGGGGLDGVLGMRPTVVCTGSANAPATGLRIPPGEPLLLERDYGMQHDRNAIAVLARGTLLGYLDRDVAGYLAPMIDCGAAVAADVAADVAVEGGGGRRPLHASGGNGVVRIGVRMRLAEDGNPNADGPDPRARAADAAKADAGSPPPGGRTGRRVAAAPGA